MEPSPNSPESPKTFVSARANAPYSWRAPSPPPIIVPPIIGGENKAICLMPSYADVDSAYLTARELDVIVAGTSEANPLSGTWRSSTGYEWTYAKRRTAQPILPYLYLGPLAVARDKEWLRNEGITMTMVARDETQLLQRFLTVDRACQELGIAVEYVDIMAKWEMVRHFPHVIRKINDHLIAVHQAAAIPSVVGVFSAGKLAVGQLPEDMIRVPLAREKKRGKVLVVCETGNDRSPPVVAAYIMAVFGMSIGEAVKFVTMNRFSCSFDETMKQILQSWGDIVLARRQVNAAAEQSCAKAKRRISETMDVNDPEEATLGCGEMDSARFEDRQAFVPFVDSDNAH